MVVAEYVQSAETQLATGSRTRDVTPASAFHFAHETAPAGALSGPRRAVSWAKPTAVTSGAVDAWGRRGARLQRARGRQARGCGRATYRPRSSPAGVTARRRGRVGL